MAAAQQTKTSKLAGMAHLLGFDNIHNAQYFLFLSMAMLYFCLTRLSYFNAETFAKSVCPGDWYFFKDGFYGVAIRVHLYTTIPAGVLMLLQFIPRLRRGIPAIHRFNGYAVLALMTIGNLTALLVMRRSFGGDIAIQTAVITLAIASQIAMFQAWKNIKARNVNAHRIWSMRAMIWMSCIVSTRVVMPIAVIALSTLDNYFSVMSCGQLRSIQAQGATVFSDGSMDTVSNLYPDCANASADRHVVVLAKFDLTRPDRVGAALDLTFGMGLWVCFTMHAVALEIYFQWSTKRVKLVPMSNGGTDVKTSSVSISSKSN